MPPSEPDRRGGQITLQGEFHSGPLPHPSLLAEYNRIVPDAANRILVMAEQQSKHRRWLEKVYLAGDISRSWGGLLSALFICVLILVLSYLLIQSGHAVSGTILGVGDMATIATVFITSKELRGATAQATPPSRKD